MVLDRQRLGGQRLLAAFFLSPLIVPGVVVGFALLMFFALIGVYDALARLLGVGICSFRYPMSCAPRWPAWLASEAA